MRVHDRMDYQFSRFDLQIREASWSCAFSHVGEEESEHRGHVSASDTTNDGSRRRGRAEDDADEIEQRATKRRRCGRRGGGEPRGQEFLLRRLLSSFVTHEINA